MYVYSLCVWVLEEVVSLRVGLRMETRADNSTYAVDMSLQVPARTT